MRKQSYKNHIRFYYPHHFIFYPLAIAFIILSAIAFIRADFSTEFALLTVSLILLTWLSFMMRQHYSLVNQDRIVRLEMRLRYFQISGKRFELYEDKLSMGQIAAMRFASDEELIPLIMRCMDQNLSPNEIKKTIKNWIPDNMRV